MRTIARLSVATAALGVSLVTAAPLALAQTSEYVGSTDTGTTDTAVKSGVASRGPAGDQAAVVDSTTGRTGTVQNARTSPTTLPFTGGEVVLVAVAGAAAVAAGAGLVLGGRRRADAAS